MKKRKTYEMDWHDIAGIIFLAALAAWFFTYQAMR